MEKILVIGIAGGSGSGKTTLMKRLVEQFGDDVTVVSHDNYYRRHDELTYEERSQINYDEPAALETDLMAYHLDCLRQGQAIDCPVYDYAAHNRSDETIRIEPRKVIIVEGIHSFYDSRLREMMDLRLFVRVDSDICLLRRIQRDINERGRDIDNISMQYTTTVKPMFDQYIRNYEQYADVIVAKGGKNAKINEILASYVNNDLHMYKGNA